MRNIIAAVFFCVAAPAYSQTTGYVVKKESGTVYMDLVAADGASLGQDFVVFTEGEELKHPITGASLGRVERQVARGHIQQIMQRYSVGQLDGSPSGAVSPGQKVRLLSSFTPLAAPAQPTAATAAPPSAMQAQPASPASLFPWMRAAAPPSAPSPQNGAVWRSPPMEMEAIDVALGDVDGDGKPEILLADANHVYAYPQTGDWKPVCQYAIAGTGSKILSIDAADLNKDGRAEVFVTYYNAVFEHVETAVLECKGGAFEKTATLPFMTRAFQDDSGETKIGAQQLIEDRTFPFGNIYVLEYKDGKYAPGIQIKAKRLEWLYGFALAKDMAGGQPFPLFITSNNHLRAQFKKKAWVSDEDYAQTADRLPWQGRERPMMFYPRMATAQKNGILDGLYIIENVPSLGSLGGAFGYYRDSKIHFLRWNGLSFNREWTADSLGGYASDLAAVRSTDGRIQELWTAVVSAEGRTFALKLQP